MTRRVESKPVGVQHGTKARPAVSSRPVGEGPVLQRIADVGPLVQGPMPAEVALKLQQLLGNKAVRRLLGLEEEEVQEEFTQEKIDQIVSEVIAEQLAAYNNIKVVIKEERPAEGGGPAAEAGPSPEAAGAAGVAEEAPTNQVEAGPEASSANEDGGAQPEAAPAAATTTPVTKEVTVRAVYFINPAGEEVQAAREASGFGDIAGSLGDQLSVLNGKNDARMSAGAAVEYGKATPEDISLFIDKAVKEGTLHRYGRQEGVLGETGLLVDLDDATLKELLQKWMYATRVGVDCTGLANIALIRAREKVREEMRAAGVPEEELPREFKHRQKPVKGKEVKKPTDLRPGDIWSTREGKHVRLVMEAYQATNRWDKEVIEFKTAESATLDNIGPVDKVWQTGSLEEIQTIRNIKGKGSTDGNFYRVKEERKKR